MPNPADLIRDVTHPDIPAEERFEANGHLFSEFIEEIASPNQGDIREALPYLLTQELTAKAASLMTDRITFGTYPSEKRFDVKGKVKGRQHVSVLEVNEYGVVTGSGDRSRWIERSNSGFDFLRSMVASVDVIKAVILTRQRQVTSFLRPERDGLPLGFHLMRTDGEKLTDRDKLPVWPLERSVFNSDNEGQLG